MVVTLLGAEAGTPLYAMASWHVFMGRRSEAWLLRRLGAFSVYREGLDRTAIRTAIDLRGLSACRPCAYGPTKTIVFNRTDRGNAANTLAKGLSSTGEPMRTEARKSRPHLTSASSSSDELEESISSGVVRVSCCEIAKAASTVRLAISSF